MDHPISEGFTAILRDSRTAPISKVLSGYAIKMDVFPPLMGNTVNLQVIWV
jgi:hypothetical protein